MIRETNRQTEITIFKDLDVTGGNVCGSGKKYLEILSLNWKKINDFFGQNMKYEVK